MHRYFHARGNALFLILIAVALFGALSYAITQSGRGGGNIAREEAMIKQARLENYQAAITAAVMRLTLPGTCTAAQISYETPAGANANPSAPSDKSCHIFHPNGGGVGWQDLGMGAGCDLANMAAGTTCNGIVYVGVYNSKRLFTTAGDSGTACYNKCSGGFNVGATSSTDGMDNTNKLVAATDVGAPYQAAILCRAIGPEWFLPASGQLGFLNANQNLGALAGTFHQTQYYKSSTENGSGTHGQVNGFVRRFNDGYVYGDGGNKHGNHRVRCTREY